MSNDQLVVTLDGPSIGESGAPVDSLTAVLDCAQNAMRLMVGHLGGRQPGPGQLPNWVREHSHMRLTTTRSGSFVAQLTLDPPPDGQTDLFNYGARALEALLAWDGREDSTLPRIVIEQFHDTAAALPEGVRLWLGDEDDPRKVEINRTDRTAKLAPQAEEAVLEGWLKEVNWDRRTAQLHQLGGEYVRLRFDAALDGEMLRLATRYIEARGRGRFNRSGDWSTVHVEEASEARTWRERFDKEAFHNHPHPKVFDPGNVVDIDLTDEEWESFDRAIREGRDA